MIPKHGRFEAALVVTTIVYALAAVMVARCAQATPPPECVDPSPLCAAMLDRAGRNIVTDIIGGRYTPQPAFAAAECARVEWWARELGVDPALAIATAWIESKFDRRAESTAGARGVMQVMPHYKCPNRSWEGCDGVRAGVASLGKLTTIYGRLRGVAAYRAGNSGWRDPDHDFGPARRRLRLAGRIKRAAYVEEEQEQQQTEER